ncbi:hypothetical protein NC651_032489 [Populus alba x Populus x berolinensis]|nr:hypothetical protein NC651_032489 [Populus alba x Populus x berolinensis]
MITFEASFKLKLQQVLDFVLFPLRTQECDDGEAFADHIRDIILMYLKQERFPKGTYNLRSNKLGPCKVLKKINYVYVIEIGFTNKPSLQ